MSVKVSNIIAIELAILIGIMSWMACFLYSHFPSAEPHTAATAEEIQESTEDDVAPVAPVIQARNQRPYTVDYRADRERARPIDEKEDEEPAPVAEQPAATLQQDYDQEYQEVATEPAATSGLPYASSGLQDNSMVETSPAYAEPIQEPALIQPDYVESPQVVAAYQEPIQFVVFSNNRRFANRFRSTPRRCAFMTATHRFPDRIGPHQNMGGVVLRRNPNAPTCRPTQGFSPGGIVRQNSGKQIAGSFGRR
jgi:hypothetical protein